MVSAISVLFILAVFAFILLVFLIYGNRLYHRKAPEASKPDPVPVTPKIYTEPAFLLQKIDERRRIMDEYRHTKICNEYFELIFELRSGERIRVSCSKTAYQEIPFRKTGILTYSNGQLIQFQTQEATISEGYVRF
ncbi:MAG: hypothetical protein IJ642_05535 [Oscillospiraceae bacterium]|nr:hypothetical protein [Oscillospiraceae bacterium]